MSQPGESILDTIVKQRLIDVQTAKENVPFTKLQEQVELLNQRDQQRTKESNEDAFGPQINFYERLVTNSKKNLLSVMAEMKRASPSKGDIAPGIDARTQGLQYATAGVQVISCLTEPKWFKGTLEDLKSIREGLHTSGVEERPALLRKDFLIDEYQIYEARVYGADTLLLIVAAMTIMERLGQVKSAKDTLQHLIQVARSLGMEPLVEVNTSDEMKIALEVGSKVIGINNRNLHNFQVDLQTTSRLVENASAIPSDVILVALSGISNRQDVEFFESIGVKAILVGETLMRANNPREKIKELRGERLPPLVKICGVMDVETAIQVADSGADMIGLVFAESRRKLTTEKAQEIARAIHEHRKHQQYRFTNIENNNNNNSGNNNNKDMKEHLALCAHELESAVKQVKPLLVGVFADNDKEFVNQIAREVPLDVIQLSGDEGFAVTNETIIPTLKAIHVGGSISHSPAAIQPGKHLLGVLLDTQDPNVRGGTGRAFDWQLTQTVVPDIPFFLAGGLNPDNIADAVKQANPFGVDVSSGVETNSKKDLDKIKQFVRLAKQ